MFIAYYMWHTISYDICSNVHFKIIQNIQNIQNLNLAEIQSIMWKIEEVIRFEPLQINDAKGSSQLYSNFTNYIQILPFLQFVTWCWISTRFKFLAWFEHMKKTRAKWMEVWPYIIWYVMSHIICDKHKI